MGPGRVVWWWCGGGVVWGGGVGGVGRRPRWGWEYDELMYGSHLRMCVAQLGDSEGHVYAYRVCWFSGKEASRQPMKGGGWRMMYVMWRISMIVAHCARGKGEQITCTLIGEQNVHSMVPLVGISKMDGVILHSGGGACR
jgi:hypothetical protein